MIGVCATLIGLVKLVEAHIGPSRVDEYAALVSLLFLAARLRPMISMRHLDRTRLSARAARSWPINAFSPGLSHHGNYAVFRL